MIPDGSQNCSSCPHSQMETPRPREGMTLPTVTRGQPSAELRSEGSPCPPGRGSPRPSSSGFLEVISFAGPCPSPRASLIQSQGCQQNPQVMEQGVADTSRDFPELPSNLPSPGSGQECLC